MNIIQLHAPVSREILDSGKMIVRNFQFSSREIFSKNSQIDKGTNRQFSPLRVLHRVLETADAATVACIAPAPASAALAQIPAASNA